MLHDVPEEDRVCDCGRDKTKIGEDVTEQLDYIPGKIEVLRHIYPKYACSCCKDGVTTAPTASGPIAGGLAAPGLLAYVSSASSSSTCRSIASRTSWPAPASSCLAEHALRLARAVCPALQAPGRIDAQGSAQVGSDPGGRDAGPGPGPLARFHQEGLHLDDDRRPRHPYTTFHYTDSRSRDGPAEFLKGFGGYLQTDAYASYESVVKESAGKIIAVGCWAHVRREFFDARHNQPREVHYVLGLIAQLYDVEDEVRRPERRGAAGGASGAERAGAEATRGVSPRAEGARCPRASSARRSTTR